MFLAWPFYGVFMLAYYVNDTWGFCFFCSVFYTWVFASLT
ncbi:putative membrane protein [Anaplasma phagocytophilum str. CRT53-1]|uniref:Putative membrane protein n=1 Tax=Anaplasma phagocytophilum str. CRT53-1 TaxID=1359157 RepID=A0A0F3Q060_ANAPH|nr:putative membrane protein [Anaplasma phagocytophilum str. CRT53-1]